MENKQIIIVVTVGLVIVLAILAVFQKSNSPEIGGGFGFFNLGSNSTPTPTAPPVVTELQGQDLKVGTGSAVISGDTIVVHYKGFFMDGKVFDSSYDRNEPFTITTGANQVIPGFDQGVIGMKVGGLRKLLIPSSFAYGEKGAGPIPPNTPLVFEVELLEIKPKEVPSPEVSSEPSPTPAPSGGP